MIGWQLMPLHWGQVTRNLAVSGVEFIGKVLAPIEGGETKSLKGSGQIKPIKGQGIKNIKGSGSIKPILGRGRKC